VNEFESPAFFGSRRLELGNPLPPQDLGEILVAFLVSEEVLEEASLSKE
jgi:hypothetical protein